MPTTLPRRDGRPVARSLRRSPPTVRSSADPAPARSTSRSTSEVTRDLGLLERLAIRRALAATAGHRANAARLLGISERTLRNKLKAMSIMVTRREDGPASHPWPARPGSSPGAPTFEVPGPPPTRARG